MATSTSFVYARITARNSPSVTSALHGRLYSEYTDNGYDRSGDLTWVSSGYPPVSIMYTQVYYGKLYLTYESVYERRESVDQVMAVARFASHHDCNPLQVRSWKDKSIRILE